MMFKDSNSNQFDKDIATQKPKKVNVDDVAKVSTRRLCNCPGSKPGIVSAEITDHKIGCHIRERILSGIYTVNTSAIPRKITDGCSLGVAIGGEDF